MTNESTRASWTVAAIANSIEVNRRGTETPFLIIATVQLTDFMNYNISNGDETRLKLRVG